MSRKNRRPRTAVRAAVAPAPSANPISRIVSNVAAPAGDVTAIPVRQRSGHIVAQQTHFQGPIPHPDIFRQYGDVIPDAPERILRVFEEDSKHTRDIQTAALVAQKEDNKRVHWMSWSLIAGGYVMAGLFALGGMQWLAGLVLTGTLAGTITGFMQNKSAPQNQQADKK
jgi:uncharacterized membrane protein